MSFNRGTTAEQKRQALRKQLRDMRAAPQFRATHNADQALYELSLAARKQGLSQQDLARAVGVSKARISKIFSGAHLPSLLTLEKLAVATGTRITITVTPEKRAEGKRSPRSATREAAARRPAASESRRRNAAHAAVVKLPRAAKAGSDE